MAIDFGAFTDGARAAKGDYWTDVREAQMAGVRDIAMQEGLQTANLNTQKERATAYLAPLLADQQRAASLGVRADDWYMKAQRNIVNDANFAAYDPLAQKIIMENLRGYGVSMAQKLKESGDDVGALAVNKAMGLNFGPDNRADPRQVYDKSGLASAGYTFDDATGQVTDRYGNKVSGPSAGATVNKWGQSGMLELLAEQEAQQRVQDQTNNDGLARGTHKIWKDPITGAERVILKSAEDLLIESDAAIERNNRRRVVEGIQNKTLDPMNDASVNNFGLYYKDPGGINGQIAAYRANPAAYLAGATPPAGGPPGALPAQGSSIFQPAPAAPAAPAGVAPGTPATIMVPSGPGGGVAAVPNPAYQAVIAAQAAQGYSAAQGGPLPAINLPGVPNAPGGGFSPRVPLTDQFNTALPPNSEARYQNWLVNKSLEQGRDVSMDYSDYDLRADFLRDSMSASAPGQHGSDIGKKPNHPTFSNQSIHASPTNPGGVWLEGAARNGQPFGNFVPSPEMFDDPTRMNDLQRYLAGPAEQGKVGMLSPYIAALRKEAYQGTPSAQEIDPRSLAQAGERQQPARSPILQQQLDSFAELQAAEEDRLMIDAWLSSTEPSINPDGDAAAIMMMLDRNRSIRQDTEYVAKVMAKMRAEGAIQ